MSKEILEQLFDSPIKVKLLKFFFRNEGKSFNLKQIAKLIKSDFSSCRRQLKKLEIIKLVGNKIKAGRKLYSVNPGFDFYQELKSLILKSSPASKKRMLRRLRGLGRINLALIAGVFVNAEQKRVDLLLVGDNLKTAKMTNFLRDLEAEVGKEIDYVVLTTQDFKYRYDMFDRFIRDVLERPHEKLINKMRI